MKKIVSAVLACVLCASVAVAAAGCGCQKSKNDAKATSGKTTSGSNEPGYRIEPTDPSFTKGDFLSMLQTDDVLMINILNYLSRNAQRAKHILMGLKEGLTVQRIALLVAALTPQKSAHIALQFRQRDLCHLLGVRRATLLNALNELSGQELITFTTTSITVPHRDALLSVLKAGF